MARYVVYWTVEGVDMVEAESEQQAEGIVEAEKGQRFNACELSTLSCEAELEDDDGSSD